MQRVGRARHLEVALVRALDGRAHLEAREPPLAAHPREDVRVHRAVHRHLRVHPGEGKHPTS